MFLSLITIGSVSWLLESFKLLFKPKGKIWTSLNEEYWNKVSDKELDEVDEVEEFGLKLGFRSIEEFMLVNKE